MADPPPSSDDSPTDPHLRVPEERTSDGTPHQPPRLGGPPAGSPPARSLSPSPSVPPPASSSSFAARPGASPSARPAAPTSARPLGGPGFPSPPLPPPGATPDFLVPRPSAPPPAERIADVQGDPWRERIANIEVQQSATRAGVQRVEGEMTRLRERIDAAASRLEALDVAVREALERVEGVARAALERAEQPLPLGALERRMNKIEILAQTLRAGVAALRQELAENRRLDEARQARIVSLEERVARAEADPRPAELVLAIDRAEARVIATEREQAAIRERLDALSASAAADRERLDRLASALERALAAFARAPGSAASCAPEPAAAGVRPLRAIPGIGAKIESKLRAAGIGDAAALAALDAVACARLAREIGVKPDKLEAWCAAARAL